MPSSTFCWPHGAGVLCALLLHAGGAFQQNPTNTPSDLLPTDGWTLQNFVSINQRISLLRSIANSLVFALGVLAGTLSFGLLAGYALARLQWRGRTSLFVVMLGVQMILSSC